jgi:hypothetical protein
MSHGVRLSASAPQPSECGTGNQAKDAFIWVFRQQERVPLGQKPASNLENWRSNKVLASNDSEDTDATQIALQPFDLDTFSIPMYNEGSSSLIPLAYHLSNKMAEEWKIVGKAMMFLTDGTLVECGDQEVQMVKIQFPILEFGFRRFDDLPNKIRLLIWKYALPGRCG